MTCKPRIHPSMVAVMLPTMELASGTRDRMHRFLGPDGTRCPESSNQLQATAEVHWHWQPNIGIEHRESTLTMPQATAAT